MLDALESVVKEACHTAFFNFLADVDDGSLGFPLAFVDWDTKEDLSSDIPYHDDFVYLDTDEEEAI